MRAIRKDKQSRSLSLLFVELAARHRQIRQAFRLRTQEAAGPRPVHLNWDADFEQGCDRE